MDHHQGQCLMMWTKRKYSTTIPRTNNTTTYLSSSYSESWEEQAFAKDAAGYIWPPRSYSCSFCRREFRSAQALGGHMNVHRRDRARLKQQQQHHQPSSPTVNHDQEIVDDYDVLEPHHNHHPGQNNFDYLYNNPSCYYHDPIITPKYASSSPVISNKLFQEGKTVIPLLNSSIFHGCLKRSSSNSKSIIVSPPHHHHNLETLCDEEKSDDDDDEGVMRLSLFVHHSAKEEEDISSFKKRKTDDSSLIPKSSSVHVESNKFHESSPPNFIEEMDLELRLGYSSSQQIVSPGRSVTLG